MFNLKHVVKILAAAIVILASGASAKQKPKPAPAAPPATAAATATPPLAASDTFFRAEGAHFENLYETWELYGDVRDQDGKRYDFVAFFGQSGGVYMNVRFGYASFVPEGGEYSYTSFVPANFKEAAVRQLKKKLESDPDNAKLKEKIAAIDKGENPHFEPLDKMGDVFRTALYIDYGKNRFVRISRDKFQYLLTLNVQGNRIFANIESSSVPVQFHDENGIGGGKTSLSMSGYVFPEMNITATLITPDSKVKTLTGRVLFAHFWCDPDRAAFSRFNMMYLPLSTGGGLYNFTFMMPNGDPLSSQTFEADKTGAVKLQPKAEIKETSYFTSELSGLSYPKTLSVKTTTLDGAISLPDTKHEMTVLEGVGSFYLGPCDFKEGLSEFSSKYPLFGRGLCRLVAPEKQ